jgi:hypothetical protein
MLEADSNEVQERVTQELANMTRLMRHFHPDSSQWANCRSEANGYMRALLENGLISNETYGRLDKAVKAAMEVPSYQPEESSVLRLLRNGYYGTKE